MSVNKKREFFHKSRKNAQKTSGCSIQFYVVFASLSIVNVLNINDGQSHKILWSYLEPLMHSLLAIIIRDNFSGTLCRCPPVVWHFFMDDWSNFHQRMFQMSQMICVGSLGTEPTSHGCESSALATVPWLTLTVLPHRQSSSTSSSSSWPKQRNKLTTYGHCLGSFLILLYLH